MSEVTTELAPIDDALDGSTDVAARIELLKAGKGVMSSAPTSTFDEKVAVFDAVTNALPLTDNLNKRIMLRNVVVQAVEINNVDDNGVLTGTVQVPRIVLIDEDGTAYAAISDGVFKSLETIFGIFGMPSQWPGALPVVASREKARVGHYFTLKVDKSKK